MLEYVQNEWSLRGVFGVSKDYVFIFSVSGGYERFVSEVGFKGFFEVFNLSEDSKVGVFRWGFSSISI